MEVIIIFTIRYIAEELLIIRDIYSNLYKVQHLEQLKTDCRNHIREIGMMYCSIEDIISHLIKMIESDENDTRWQRWDVKMEFNKMANHIMHIANRLEKE